MSAKRLLLWLALSLPGWWLVGRWALTPDAYGYGHAIADSGQWAAWLLMVTLAVTPIRLAFRRSALAKWLVRYRRDLGVASFAYASLHTLVYLDKKATLANVLEELPQDFIWSGWLALALFVPLAVTSNDVSMRWLKKSWKALHRLVYPAAILTFLHWIWSAFDPTTAWIHAGVLAAIEIARLWLQRARA